jgi:hypothetical protein
MKQTRPPWFQEFLDAELKGRPPNITPAEAAMAQALITADIYEMLTTGQARFKNKHGRWPTETELDEFVLTDEEIEWRSRR